MIEKKKYSIVATYIHDNQKWYYRLADYDFFINKWVEANYNTEDNGYEYEPVSLYSRDIKIEYEAMIKKWETDEHDETKHYVSANDLEAKVYEVVYLRKDIENEYYDEKNVRSSLEKGFLVSKQVNNRFLLIVGKDKYNLYGLYCEKSKFKKTNIEDDYEMLYVDKNDMNLEHSLISINLYKIARDSIIGIDNLLQHPFSKSINVVNRYFYRELNLPVEYEIFLTRKVEDYLPTFFSKYFKDMKDVYSLTNKDKTKFVNIIRDILDSRNYIDQFETKTGYKSEIIYTVFKEISEIILKILSNEDEMSEILLNTLKQDAEYYNRCLAQVKDEWEKSSDYEQEKLSREKILNDLCTDIEEVQLQLNKYNDNLEDVKHRYEEIENECKDIENKKVKIQEEINHALVKYKGSMIDLIDHTIPIDLMKNNTMNPPAIKGYTHKKNKEHSEQCEKLEDFDDFYDCLSDNLSLYYTDTRCCDLSASILATIANYRSLIVDEAYGEILANSLAMLVDNRRVDKYSVFNIEVNTNRLLHSIANNNNSIIYIDGVVNSYNESLIKLLVKGFPNKVFIFGADEENILELSKGVWKFANYIDVNSDFEIKDKGRLIFSMYDLKTLRGELNKQKYIGINDWILRSLLKDSDRVNIESMLNVYLGLNLKRKIPVFFLNLQILNSYLSKDELIDILLENNSKQTILETLLRNEVDV